MCPYEACESRVANLLAGMDNLPEDDYDGKIAVLMECVVEQQQEIEELRKTVESAKFGEVLKVDG